MEKLGLYTLSTILSYLSEKEGVTFLLSNRKFAYRILPIFRCNSNVDASLMKDAAFLKNTRSAYGELDISYINRLKRYEFKVSPVQDPMTLLDRLNTRRLYKRLRRMKHNKRNELHIKFSTSELAQTEWQQQSKTVTKSENAKFLYPPEQELLRFRSIKDLDNTNLKYLYGHDWSKLKTTLIASYPRSGNTLARTLLERTTGYVTGSDTRPDRSLSKELAEQHNLVGEGIVSSQRVVFVKTHYPERIGNQIFLGHSAIILVRNPYDAIDSYWNMNATKSHTKSVSSEVYDQFRDFWHNLVRNEIHMWNKFLEFWLNDACPIPVLVVRFEDLIQNPQHQVFRMMEFTITHNYGKPLLSQFWKSRIQHATSMPSTVALGSYQPRSAVSGISSIGKSLRKGHYTDELIEYIQQVCAISYSENFLRRFGYDISDHNFPNNFLYSTTDSKKPSIHTPSKVCTTGDQPVVRVNAEMPIRPVDCPYGRLLQQWRHSVTNNDENPLPTIEK